MPKCPKSATAPLSPSETVRPEEWTTGLVRCMPISSGEHDQSGVALVGEPLERIEAVAGPDAVGAVEDAEIDARAARRAALDLQSRVTGLELVEQAVERRACARAPG